MIVIVISGLTTPKKVYYLYWNVETKSINGNILKNRLSFIEKKQKLRPNTPNN